MTRKKEKYLLLHSQVFYQTSRTFIKYYKVIKINYNKFNISMATTYNSTNFNESTLTVQPPPPAWPTHWPFRCLTHLVRSVAWQHPDGARWWSLRSRSASDGLWMQLAAEHSPPARLAPKSPWQRCRRSQQMLSPSPSPWQLHPEHHDGAGWPVGVAFRVVRGSLGWVIGLVGEQCGYLTSQLVIGQLNTVYVTFTSCMTWLNLGVKTASNNKCIFVIQKTSKTCLPSSSVSQSVSKKVFEIGYNQDFKPRFFFPPLVLNF